MDCIILIILMRLVQWKFYESWLHKLLQINLNKFFWNGTFLKYILCQSSNIFKRLFRCANAAFVSVYWLHKKFQQFLRNNLFYEIMSIGVENDS